MKTYNIRLSYVGDHWSGQSDNMKILREVQELKWISGISYQGYQAHNWRGKCTDETATLLALRGATITVIE